MKKVFKHPLERRLKRSASSRKSRVKNPEHYKAYYKKYRAEHPEKIKGYREKYNKKHPGRMKYLFNRWIKENPDKAMKRELNLKVSGKSKQYSRTTRYSLKQEQYDNLIKKQNNKCLGCNRIFVEPCVDHCYLTGKIRGLLCHPCNWILGYAKDSQKTLLNLVAYLKKGEKLNKNDLRVKKYVLLTLSILEKVNIKELDICYRLQKNNF